MLIDEHRSIEEAYASATTTSDLRVQADIRGDADILIAAGWSAGRIGSALLRLHSEFDGAEKPRLADYKMFLAACERTFEVANPGKSPTKAQHKVLKTRAHAEAHAYNLHETGMLLGKLKALPDVRAQVTIQLMKWRVEEAETISSEILRWWLAQTCPVCGGVKFQIVEGTGRHNGKACTECKGTGLRATPRGEVGRRLANWMDGCVQSARGDIGRRLRASMGRD